MRRRIILISVVGIILSGCATAGDKRDWDCPAQSGLGCLSIADTAKRILGGNRVNKKVDTFQTQSPELETPSYTTYAPDYGPVSSVPSWTQEDILKIHVMPFVDAVNSYHEQSVIYSVVSTGGWSRD